ncbi:hypothetical protein [Methanolacinia paynteri]|uniref:hypothetical protein n=1 Tax=Methanolacinia paynteri TaxID=230356 RepID=UPI000694E913|nr:hypothetical protein [Methanolacinia paynteri]
MDLIIGGGTYGKLALEKIRDDGRLIVVIDEDPGCIVQKEFRLPEISGDDTLPEEGSVFIKGSVETAAGFVAGSSENSGPGEYMKARIFPTAPVHIAAGIISELCGFVPDPERAEAAAGSIPEELIAGKKDADIYCTLNKKEPCLPLCSSPKICPVTKERRDVPLWETLENCLSGDRKPGLPASFVIESRQLCPGLGYIDYSDLTDVIKKACRKDSVLVGTACTCHGVVTALKKT